MLGFLLKINITNNNTNKLVLIPISIISAPIHLSRLLTDPEKCDSYDTKPAIDNIIMIKIQLANLSIPYLNFSRSSLVNPV